MTVPYTRCDSIREYLTGAAADGDAQDSADQSFGNYRSSVEAASYGIQISNPVQGIVVEFVSGGNAAGVGYLSSEDGYTLKWTAPGEAVPGAGVLFTPDTTTVLIVESSDPASFLRISGTPPFVTELTPIILTILLEGVYAFDNVADADATAGISQYRATIIRNESGASVTEFYRWIEELGTAQVSNQTQLGGAGSGTIRTSGSLADWPTTGWCRIEDSGGTLREIVYYSTRTEYVLTVPAAGRGLLGTSPGAGTATDLIHAVPGIAIAFDAAGVQAFGSPIDAPGDDITSPGGVTWNTGITKATGLSLAELPRSRQIGVWMWRHIPAGCHFAPNVYHQLVTDFFAY